MMAAPFSLTTAKIGFPFFPPENEEEIKDYNELLAQDLVAPMAMEIYTMNIDGSGF